MWALVVGVLLAAPESALPSVSGWLPEAVQPWADKLVHGFLFFVLAALGLRSARALPGIRRPLVFVAAATLVYAVILELIQTQVPGRGWELFDLVAGILGIGLALVLIRDDRADRG